MRRLATGLITVLCLLGTTVACQDAGNGSGPRSHYGKPEIRCGRGKHEVAKGGCARNPHHHWHSSH
jgi:hypothetical protein